MKKVLFTLTAVIFLSSCATPPSAVIPTQNSLAAANAQATINIAAELTRQAVEETRVIDAQSTAYYVDAVNAADVQATAVSYESTRMYEDMIVGVEEVERVGQVDINTARELASIKATADMNALDILVVSNEINDEAQRLQNIRNAERQQIDSDRLWSTVYYPAILFAVLMVFFVGGILAGLFIYRNKQTEYEIVDVARDNTDTFARTPSGFISLAPPRLALPEPAHEGEVVEQQSEMNMLEALHGSHAIYVVGESGSGKTTAVKWLVSVSQNPVILDPHALYGAYPNCPVIGGARGFDQIEAALAKIAGVVTSRFDDLAHLDAGEYSHEHVTVFIDEQMAINTNAKDTSGDIRLLLTEARKVEMTIVMVNHTEGVMGTGFKGSGDLREGFTYLLLNSKNGRYSATVRSGLDKDSAFPVRTMGEFDNSIQPLYSENNAAMILGLPAPSTSGRPQIVETRPHEATFCLPDGNDLSMKDVGRALAMREAGETQAKIEMAIFGYSGGQAWKNIKAIFNVYGDPKAATTG